MKFNCRKWFWGHCIAWIMGIVFSLFISEPIESIFLNPIQFYLGITMGFSISLVQWLFLKEILGLSFNWVMISTILMGGGMFLAETIHLVEVSYQLPLSVLVGSLSLSIGQAIYLKLSRSIALFWISSNLTAWLLSALAVYLINYTMLMKGSDFNLIIACINLLLILSGGVFHGILTFHPMKKIVDS